MIGECKVGGTGIVCKGEVLLMHVTPQLVRVKTLDWKPLAKLLSNDV